MNHYYRCKLPYCKSVRSLNMNYDTHTYIFILSLFKVSNIKFSYTIKMHKVEYKEAYHILSNTFFYL